MGAAELRFLSVDQVIRLHDALLTRYGGARIPGHRGEEEGVAAAVLAVVNSYYEDPFELAGAYAVYILMGHVFGDGNKRTASAAALTFLALNGIAIDAKPDDLVDLVIGIQRTAESDPLPPASELISLVAGWLRRHRS